MTTPYATLYLILFSLLFSNVSYSQINHGDLNQKVSITVDSAVAERRSGTVIVYFNFHNTKGPKYEMLIGDSTLSKADNYRTTQFVLAGKSTSGRFVNSSILSRDSIVLGSVTFSGISIGVEKLDSISLYGCLIELSERDNNKPIIPLRRTEGFFTVSNVPLKWIDGKRVKPTKSRISISLGVGLTSIYFKEGYTSSKPINTNLMYEQAINDVFGFGLNASYGTYKLSPYKGTYRENLNYLEEKAIYVGGRGYYYFDKLLHDIEQPIPRLSFYAGISLGYIYVSTEHNTYGSNTPESGFGFGAFAGSKFKIANWVGLYAEGGYTGLSYFNGGIFIKF